MRLSQKVVVPAGAPLFEHARQRNLHFSRDRVEGTQTLFRLRAAGTSETEPEDTIAPTPVAGPVGGGILMMPPITFIASGTEKSAARSNSP
jgi:hypothetical protein